ncbi:sulfotransferase family protein [Aestuariispira insulae]|uniref:Sulfotransferase family protein n=2 Tax=Aestuariispira insulae TaxID=1461337 RepID=A0A3D9HK59_9PROT|nr:sulfotransferase family protein [Aestuariispira insulae]
MQEIYALSEQGNFWGAYQALLPVKESQPMTAQILEADFYLHAQLGYRWEGLAIAKSVPALLNNSLYSQLFLGQAVDVVAPHLVTESPLMQAMISSQDFCRQCGIGFLRFMDLMAQLTDDHRGLIQLMDRFLSDPEVIKHTGYSTAAIGLYCRHFADAAAVAEKIRPLYATDDGTFPPAIAAELSRYEARFTDQIPATATQSDLFHEMGMVPSYAMSGTRESHPADTGANWITPEIDPVRLKAGIEKLMARTARWLEDEGSPHPAPALRAMRDGGIAPISVLSTGRVGTTALQVLAGHSDRLSPYHYLSQNIAAGDRNHLLYRLMDGTADDTFLDRFIERYLTFRFAELYVSHSQGRRAIIVNHLDTLFTPIMAAIFPKATFLHAYRNPGATLISLAYKNQFQFAQLRHLKYDPGYPSGLFLHSRDPNLSLEQECAWYMHVTDLYARSLGELLPQERFLSLDMEDLFAGNPNRIETFISFIGDDELTPELCRETFSRKINEKSHRVVSEAHQSQDRAAEILSHCRQQLTDNGRF